MSKYENQVIFNTKKGLLQNLLEGGATSRMGKLKDLFEKSLLYYKSNEIAKQFSKLQQLTSSFQFWDPFIQEKKANFGQNTEFVAF